MTCAAWPKHSAFCSAKRWRPAALVSRRALARARYHLRLRIKDIDIASSSAATLRAEVDQQREEMGDEQTDATPERASDM